MDRQRTRFGLVRPSAKAQLQPFFDDLRQARAVLRCQRLGVGEQGVIQIESGLQRDWVAYRFL